MVPCIETIVHCPKNFVYITHFHFVLFLTIHQNQSFFHTGKLTPDLQSMSPKIVLKVLWFQPKIIHLKILQKYYINKFGRGIETIIGCQKIYHLWWLYIIRKAGSEGDGASIQDQIQYAHNIFFYRDIFPNLSFIVKSKMIK